MPDWINVVKKNYKYTLEGTAGPVGTYDFQFKFTDSNAGRPTYAISITINVVSFPDNVNYGNFGIDAQLDDYLNPFRYGGNEQTLTTTNDKSIRLKPGYYGFKFKGWLWGEEHNSDLVGDTHGLVKDSDGNWVGNLAPGNYDFTVAITKDNLSFKFYIQVNAKMVNVTYQGDGFNTTTQVTYGEHFDLPLSSDNNYTLKGWYKSDGTYVGAPGGSYVVHGDTSLYAKWVSNVIVMDSAGTVLDVMEVEKDSTCTLPAVTKEGYEFNYWSTEADGDAVISDGTSPYKPTGDIVLYPVFTDDLRFPIPKFSLVTEG